MMLIRNMPRYIVFPADFVPQMPTEKPSAGFGSGGVVAGVSKEAAGSLAVTRVTCLGCTTGADPTAKPQLSQRIEPGKRGAEQCGHGWGSGFDVRGAGGKAMYASLGGHVYATVTRKL